MLICPNVVVNIQNEIARKRKLFNFGTLQRLVLPLNVGKRNGKTFIGGVPNAGNHWALVLVELRPFKGIVYCDTLAWDPPSNIIDVVNNYTTHLPGVGSYGVNHLSLAHSPMTTSRSGHQCDWRCRNYPLQTCCDICGVIALINAALAALDKPLFQYLIGPHEKESIYLQRPSQHSYYLRRIVMSWFAEGKIDIEYVRLQPDWRDNVSKKSDHSFCIRQDTSISCKKKIKLSLNAKTSSSSGLTQEQSTQDHSSCGKSCSHNPFAASVTSVTKNQNKTCVPNTNQSFQSSSSISPSTLPPEACLSPSAEQSKHTTLEVSSPMRSPMCSSSPLTKTHKTVTMSSTNSTTNHQPCFNSSPPKADKVTSTPEAGNVPSTSPEVSVTRSRFQCETCGLQLSSRNCLYKHRLRKHKPSRKLEKAAGCQHIVCPECKDKESR